MALRLEKELAKGADMLMPDPDRTVRLNGGVIPLDDQPKGFPPEFLAGLMPEEVKGLAAWRVTLRVDDTTGAAVFYNADGKAFWTVAADRDTSSRTSFLLPLFLPRRRASSGSPTSRTRTPTD